MKIVLKKKFNIFRTSFSKTPPSMSRIWLTLVTPRPFSLYISYPRRGPKNFWWTYKQENLMKWAWNCFKKLSRCWSNWTALNSPISHRPHSTIWTHFSAPHRPKPTRRATPILPIPRRSFAISARSTCSSTTGSERTSSSTSASTWGRFISRLTIVSFEYIFFLKSCRICW